MKTKVIIENGEVDIVLTPETDFEKDVIEKMVDKQKNYTISTYADTQHKFGNHSEHNIKINIKQVR